MLGTHNRRSFCGHLALLAIAVISLQLQLADAASAEDNTRAPGDELLGEWWTENNEGRIAIARYKDGTYRGTTTCCERTNDKDNPNIDVNNPNPALRKRSTTGIVLIWNLRYENGAFVDGHVYNPRDGKTYRMKITIVDHETVKIRGYMGIELLGQTQIWKRAHLDSKPPSAN